MNRTALLRCAVLAGGLLVGGVSLALRQPVPAPAAAALASVPACTAYSGLPPGWGQDPQAGMVQLPAGTVQLGTLKGYADEAPTGEVLRVGAFRMDRTEVTNAQFAAFVAATGHMTTAEREGAAAVFRVPPKRATLRADSQWWVWQRSANWRHPEGPGSANRANEPVALVTYADALAYARWLGRDLPTEAEWEYAARGGGDGERIGREPRDPQGRPVANYWQGVFPDLNSTEDGFAALAPVGCFAANGYGLHDVIGNAWELTRDRYTGPHQPHGNGDPARAPLPGRGAARRGQSMVIKGGSFLCAADYCIRYRVTARHAHEADLATSHVGFRTVKRDPG